MADLVAVDAVKRCGKCREMKSLDSFGYHVKHKQQPWCRACNAEYQRLKRSPSTSSTAASSTADCQHLYIMTFVDEELSLRFGCKVGRSKDPESRALQLTQSLPMALKVVATFQDQGSMEPVVHDKLRAHQLATVRSKEWFLLRPFQAVALVASILAEARSTD